MSDLDDHNWMRVVLGALFDLPRERALEAIRSTESLAALRADLERPAPTRGGIAGIPDGEYGDNLLMAMLALRAKFPWAEASAKLETNIAMRAGRRGSARP